MRVYIQQAASLSSLPFSLIIIIIKNSPKNLNVDSLSVIYHFLIKFFFAVI